MDEFGMGFYFINLVYGLVWNFLSFIEDLLVGGSLGGSVVVVKFGDV